jgi:sugar phosphate isomerase/epimerase
MVLGVENHFGYTSHAQDLLRVLELAAAGTAGDRGEEGWAVRGGGGVAGVCLDTGNLLPGQDPARVAEQLAPRAVHVHFKSFRPQDPAERRRNQVMLAALARAGYRGSFSVEYEGPGDGLAGAVAAAAQARETWSGL